MREKDNSRIQRDAVHAEQCAHVRQIESRLQRQPVEVKCLHHAPKGSLVKQKAVQRKPRTRGWNFSDLGFPSCLNHFVS